jgi:hypothetical protein
MILLSCGLVAAAGIVFQMFMPRDARAASACTPAVVSGTYGFQFAATYGPDPNNPEQATVPFAELGTFVTDENGNMNGASDASYGGSIYHQTFSGTVTYNEEDCTAEVNGMNHTLDRPFTLRWVIVHPGEEMMLFSLEPGTVGPGRAVRIGAESQLDRIEGLLRDIRRRIGRRR